MRPSTALPALFSLSLAALLALSAASPAAAQDAAACSNEVQRLSDGFPNTTSGQAPAGAIAQQPGTRLGASMNDSQQSQVRDSLQQARTAGQSGNGALCMQNLNQARTLLRQAGVGSPMPGDASAAGQDLNTRNGNLQGTEPSPQQRSQGTGVTGGTPGAPGVSGGPLSGTGAPNAQGAETPASPPMATPPSRNTRDSAVGSGAVGSGTARGTTGTGGATGGATSGGAGGSSGGGGGGGR